MNEHISFQGVKYRYSRSGGTVTCEDFHVVRGEFLSLLGKSGAGKSTFLKLAGGMLVPQEGEVLLNGRNVSQISPAGRKIGYVPQRLSLFPHLTVEENVGFRLSASRQPRDDVRRESQRIMQDLGIDELSHRRPTEISGGQAQRVALGRALAGDVELLFLDEPFASLDRVNIGDAVELLSRVHRSNGLTTILVTHDRDQALALSDRIAVVVDGRIAQVGTPRCVYARPATPEIALLSGEGNLLHGTVRVVGSGHRVVLDSPLGTLPSTWMNQVPAHEGEGCLLLIRPEWVTLDGTGVPQWQVTRSMWRGRDVELELVNGSSVLTVAVAQELASTGGHAHVGLKEGVVVPSYRTST